PFSSDRFGVQAGVGTPGAPTGQGSGGAAFSLRCPNNTVMTGVTGSTKLVFGFATVVENLTIQCRGGGSPIAGGPVHAGVSTTPLSLLCPIHGVVTGIQSNADHLLDALQLQCR